MRFGSTTTRRCTPASSQSCTLADAHSPAAIPTNAVRQPPPAKIGTGREKIIERLLAQTRSFMHRMVSQVRRPRLSNRRWPHRTGNTPTRRGRRRYGAGVPSRITPSRRDLTKSLNIAPTVMTIAPCSDPAGDIMISSPRSNSHRPSHGAWNSCSAVVICSMVAIQQVVYRAVGRCKAATPAAHRAVRGPPCSGRAVPAVDSAHTAGKPAPYTLPRETISAELSLSHPTFRARLEHRETPMPHERPVGIDLGTTFSAAAWVDESGQTAMIRNAEGDLLTPSVVLFTDKEVVVGKEARTATTVHPELVAEWVKRDMGLPYYTPADPRPETPAGSDPGVHPAEAEGRHRPHAGRAGPRGHHRAGLFRRAAAQGHRRRRRDGRPEGAGHRQRADRRRAGFGEIARLPDARRAAVKEKMTILVYDLGGGTFDATLLRLSPGKIETIATDGDVQLGGHDWDLRLVDHLADRFQQAAQARPAARPGADEPHAGRGDRRQARPERPRPDDRPRRIGRPGDGSPGQPRAVRGDDRRPAGADGLHHAAIAHRGRDGVEGR